MLGRCSVPILPFRSRSGIAANVQSGAVVSVYNPMADGSAAVSPEGVVASGAVLAPYIYADRNGVRALPNPITLDAFGSPDEQSWSGSERTTMTFFNYPDTYHLLVKTPTGAQFGIPFVPCADNGAAGHWVTQLIPELYTQSGGSSQVPTTNTLFIHQKNGTDMVADTSIARVIACHSSVGAANAGHWSGEEPYTGAQEGDDPFVNTSAEAAAGGAIGIWGRQWIMEAAMLVDLVTNPTATMISGMGMGNMTGIATPIAGSPTPALVMLYARWNTPAWELLVCKGGVASTKTVLSGTPSDPNTAAHLERMKIVYNGVAKWIECFINNVSIGKFTTASAFPAASSTKSGGMFCGAQSGSDAAGNCSNAWWNARYRVYMPT